MKFTLFTVAAAGLVAAQDFGNQPACAVQCLRDNIAKVGCSLEDTACQCSTSVQQQLVGVVGPCLIQQCSSDDLIKAQSAGAEACKRFASTASGFAASGSGSDSVVVTSTTTGVSSITSTATTTETNASTTSTHTVTTTFETTGTETHTTLVPSGAVVGNSTAFANNTSTPSGIHSNGSSGGSGPRGSATTGAPAATTANAATRVAAGLLPIFAAALAL